MARPSLVVRGDFQNWHCPARDPLPGPVLPVYRDGAPVWTMTTPVTPDGRDRCPSDSGSTDVGDDDVGRSASDGHAPPATPDNPLDPSDDYVFGAVALLSVAVILAGL